MIWFPLLACSKLFWFPRCHSSCALFYILSFNKFSHLAKKVDAKHCGVSGQVKMWPTLMFFSFHLLLLFARQIKKIRNTEQKRLWQTCVITFAHNIFSCDLQYSKHRKLNSTCRQTTTFFVISTSIYSARTMLLLVSVLEKVTHKLLQTAAPTTHHHSLMTL